MFEWRHGTLCKSPGPWPPSLQWLASGAPSRAEQILLSAPRRDASEPGSCFMGRRSPRPRPVAVPGTSFHRASFFLVLAFKFLPWNQLTLHVVRKISKVQEGGLLLLGLLCEETDVLSLLKSARHLLHGERSARHPAQGPAGPLPVPWAHLFILQTLPQCRPLESGEPIRPCHLGLLQGSTETGSEA